MGYWNNIGFFWVHNDNWCLHAFILGNKSGILCDHDNNRCPHVIHKLWEPVLEHGGKKNHGSCRNTSNLDYTR